MSAEAFINWALSTGLDVSILIALVLVCRRPFARMFGARAAYSLWLLPILRFVLPDISLALNLPKWMTIMPNTTPELIAANLATPPNIEWVAATPPADPINWQLGLLILWVTVAVTWLADQLWRQHKFIRDIKKSGVKVSPQIEAKAKAAIQTLNLKKSPNVLISKNNEGPMVTGLFKSTIILPHNFETAFDDRQQFFALTHELAHVKRHDLWAAFAILVFRALNWPNPLVHFGATKFRGDQEAACDAYVLRVVGADTETKQSYAGTLIHAARLTRNLAGETPTANPLCLTIYHPLKERLMTMKNHKNSTTILSRIGVGAFLVAALAATAPITIAAADDGQEVKVKSKKVIKWVEDNDGDRSEKTYEITEENGETVAVTIDEHGNRIPVELSEIKGMGGDNVFFVDGNQDGDVKKHIKILKGTHGDALHEQIIIKLKDKDLGDAQTYAFSSSDNIELDFDGNVFLTRQGGHAKAMVRAAQGLLDQAETMSNGEELSDKARKKIEKARKALAEAQAALEE